MGRMNWLSGVQFEGWFKTHLLTGPNKCSFTFADGAKWEGQLLAGDSFCVTTGEGLLTLPNGLQKQVRTHRHNRTRTTARNTHGCMFQCMLETSHGRGLNDIHLWTVDGHEKYIVNRQVRGVLERVDEFEETDYEDSGDDEDNGGNDQAASAGGHEDVDPALQDLLASTSSMSA